MHCNRSDWKDENGEQKTTSKVVVFPHLETLTLYDLPNLKGFFLGINEFRWPLLHDITIADYPHMTVFTSGQLKAPKLEYVCTSLGKHSVEHELNIHWTTNQHVQVHLFFFI